MADQLIKLTDSNHMTRNSTLWGPGVRHELSEINYPRLCTRYVLHAYRSANLGLIMNEVLGSIWQPVMWRAEGDVVASDAVKVSCFWLTTVEQLPMPDWYMACRSLRDRHILSCALVAHTWKALPPDSRIEVAGDRFVAKQVMEVADSVLDNPFKPHGGSKISPTSRRANYRRDLRIILRALNGSIELAEAAHYIHSLHKLFEDLSPVADQAVAYYMETRNRFV